MRLMVPRHYYSPTCRRRSGTYFFIYYNLSNHIFVLLIHFLCQIQITRRMSDTPRSATTVAAPPEDVDVLSLASGF